MDIAVGMIIACAVVGMLSIGAWFYLADSFINSQDPAREILYDRAAVVCFLTAMGTLAICVVLALGLLAR